ncbi:MAG: hypothetical protein WCA49_09440 [Candidatus Sulfotelmatobacter sp.]
MSEDLKKDAEVVWYRLQYDERNMFDLNEFASKMEEELNGEYDPEKLGDIFKDLKKESVQAVYREVPQRRF